MARKKEHKSVKTKKPTGEISEAMALRKKSRLRRRRRFFSIVLGIILCIGLYYVSGLDYFIIQEIITEGNEHYTSEEIIQRAKADTGVNMFRVLLFKWKDNLEKDPYISRAAVHRGLPDKINIKVTERKEKYAVAYDGKFVIIDEEAIALRKADTSEAYIAIEGISLKEVSFGQKIEDESKLQNVDKVLTALVELETEGIPVKKITITDLLVTVHIYDKLVFKTEYGALTVNMQNLKGILQDLKERGIERGTIKGQDGDLAFSPKIE